MSQFQLSWQKVWDQILKGVLQNKTPHAFLFAGQSVNIDMPFIKAFVQFFLCIDPTPMGACQQCRSCHLFAQECHPDFTRLGQDADVTIEEVREITKNLSQTPHQSERRVITLSANKLPLGAANALLKILEEPPVGTVFILSVDNIRKILPTIKSRCYIIFLPFEENPLNFNEKTPMNDYINEIFFNRSNSLFYSKEWQEMIALQPKEILYLLYNRLADGLTKMALNTADLSDNNRMHTDKIKNTLGFMEKIIESIKALTLPGVNKLLLFETLWYQWQSCNLFEVQ